VGADKRLAGAMERLADSEELEASSIDPMNPASKRTNGW
jgi:hypothetical protein